MARAAAEIPGDGLPNLELGGIRILLQQREGSHHHARGAEAALQTVLLEKPLLDGMECRTIRQTLDGLQVVTIRLDREHGAGLDRLAVEQDRARAAARGVAADVGPGQSQILPDQVNQQQPGLDLGAVGSAIDGHTHG
jgi:hypothetical protein